ncbi:hypothetical protein DICVIV_06197 [Dictyocaulus viviparus]|uniref:Uncharacterized protein n=1 Tax=Dictyocaulus viviparus TaxID=29172 RepID=A0A0D8XT99_DICVI|nr:hypothetical protein DICVIV_06197 [Dictyocaulus viviparus]
MWKLLTMTLRLKKHAAKSENDITRLRQCAFIFCQCSTEENLLLLVEMTCWFYFYYFPQRRLKFHRQNSNCRELMKNGLYKELCGSSDESKSLMKELHEFISVTTTSA